MTPSSATRGSNPGWPGVTRFLAGSYLLLGTFALVAHAVPRMTALWLVVASLAFALPPMVALWHQATVRRLIARHQFRPTAFLHRWTGRRALSILVSATFSVALSVSVLLQGVFFGPAEWGVLVASPVLYALLHAALAARSGGQFARPVYASRWLIWATSLTTIVLLTLLWAGIRYATAADASRPLAELMHELQKNWASTPSSIVRWALDAAAWGQVAVDRLHDLPDDVASQTFVALLIAPLSVFSHFALSLSALKLNRADVRRIMAESTTDADEPPPVGPVRAGVWAAVATVCVMALLWAFAYVEDGIDAASSPFAVTPLVVCERIGGTVYRVDTISKLRALTQEAAQALGPDSQACRTLAGVPALAEPAIQSYLDWYFSLGADYARLGAMLTGGADELLRSRLEQSLREHTGLGDALSALKEQQRRRSDVVAATDERIRRLLEASRLVVDERQCKVVRELSRNPWDLQHAEHKKRLLAGSGSALLAGTFAGKVASKAVGKATMKKAGTVLAKAAAKKSTGKLLGAGAGALAGSFLPGVGTAVGAVVGTVIGLLVGTGVDFAMLVAEERLTRDDMAQDVREALAQSLQPFEDVFGCR